MIKRNPDGSLQRLHPYAPTFVVVCRNGRRIYHDAEAKIRQFVADNAASVIGFYVVNRGRTIALPLHG